MKRCSVVLETNEKTKLQHIALEQGRSMSDIIRDLVRDYLEKNSNQMKLSFGV